MDVLGVSVSTWVLVVLPIGFVIYEVLWIAYCRTLHPLASIPGDFWPAVSRTWIMHQMQSGSLEEGVRKLHAKYGPVVRVAPNEVSASEASAISKVYSTQKPLPKTDFYPTYRPIGISKRADLFTDTDEWEHSRLRRIVSPVYTMASIQKSEKAIDDCLRWLVKRLSEFAEKEEVLDLGHWIEMFTYDVVGALFFGAPFGMLEKGHDHLNYIENVWNGLPLLGLAATAPSYLRPFIMFGSLLIPEKFKAVSAVNRITAEALKQTAQRKKDSEAENSVRNDLLSQLFRIVRTREAEQKHDFTDKEVALEAWVGIIAGSDSTSIAIRCVLYNLMKHPGQHAKVLTEIREAEVAGKLSSPVKQTEGAALPYTCAAIKEALRVFPPWQMHMPRVAPEQGLELSGKYIPAGYRVGVNPALCQFDPAVFGPDADEFRPERWLESQEKNTAMEKAILHFGAGTRTCIGRNIAWMEIHKTIPELLRHFEFVMSHGRPWKTKNSCFIMQQDMTVYVKRRSKA